MQNHQNENQRRKEAVDKEDEFMKKDRRKDEMTEKTDRQNQQTQIEKSTDKDDSI